MKSKNVLCTTSSVFAMLMLAGAAHAQTAEPIEEEAVVVTGSRITRQDYVATSPITTVNADRIDQSPSVTIDAVLNELPQFRGSVGQSDAFPTRGGQSNLNLRGLRANRALVLMNGRRIQPANPDGTIDVNVIPTNLVSSIETVTGGASATYGSDAMSGVVNFLLKDDFSGVQFDLQYGGPTEGDAHSSSASLLMGGDFAEGRGNGVLSVSWAERSALLRGDRDFFRVNTTNTRLPYALANLSANPPTQAAIDTLFGQYGYAPGSVGRTAQLGYNIDGTFFSSPGNAPVVNFNGYGNDDQFFVFNNAVVNNSGRTYAIQIPLTRYNVFAAADYELSGSMEVYGQAFFTHYTAPAPGPQLSLGAGGSNGMVSVNNPFIPDDLRAVLATRANPTAAFPITYLMTQIDPYVDDNRYNIFQIQTGVRGELPLEGWTWDVYGAFGRTDSTNTLYNNGHLPTVQRLLGAADGGASICAGGFNPWAAPEQALSQQCLDLIGRDPTTISVFEQQLVEATVAGELFSLPAGAVQFAGGASYRYDYYDVKPDDLLQTNEGIGTFLTLPATGDQDVMEAFGELLIPILSDLPLVQELNLSLAYRYSDYSTIGGVQTYKGDVEWSPFDWARIRGGYSRAIRAPSLGELYTPAASTSINIGQPSANGTSGDPCDVRSSYRLGPNAAQVRALCLAQGISDSAIDSYTYTGTTVFARTEGNTSLSEESADTYSLGLVLRSEWDHPLLERLQASVDYFDITVNEAIGVLPFATGLSRCFNSDGSNPNYDASNFNCVVVARDTATGRINNGLIPTLNLAQYRTEGVDLQVDWRADLADIFGGDGDLGEVGLSTVVSHLMAFELQTLPGTPALDYAGYTSSPLANQNVNNVMPKWKSVTTATYGIGPVELGLRWRHIGEVDDISRLTSTTSTIAGVEPYDYFDAFGTWDVNERLQIAAGVNNVADTEPPQIGLSPGTTDWQNYDVIGRAFFIRFRASLQ